MIDRKEELLKAIEHDAILVPSVEKLVYLEEELDRLQKMPKYKVHPNDPTKQKILPAAKLYKEYLQQYNNLLKIILRATGTCAEDDESPLRKWINGHIDSE